MTVINEAAPAYVRLADLTHDSAAWHERRRDSIGASEIAAVLGCSPWQSRLSLYLLKTDEATPEHDDSELLELGLLLEPAIVAEVARRAGVTIAARNPCLRSVLYTWATASPDAVTENGEPVEVKNLPFGYDDKTWERGIPEHYWYQCQHQMLVTGARRCLFGVLVGGSKIVWEWVARDEESIRRIVLAGTEFWERVQKLDPPPAEGHPRERLALAATATDEAPIELHEADIEDALGAYERSREQRLEHEREAKRLKKLEDAAANQIAQQLGRHSRGFTCTGWDFAWKTTERRGYTVKPSTQKRFVISKKGQS